MGCRKMETAKNWLMERILNSKGNSLKKWLIHQRKIKLSLSVWLDHNLLENQPWWILHSAHNSSQVLVDVQKVFISLLKNFLTIIKLKSSGYWCLTQRVSKAQRKLMMNMTERLFFLQCFQQIHSLSTTEVKLILRWLIL